MESEENAPSDDPLAGPPASAPERDNFPRRITCEFCEVKLTRGGEIVEMSAKAKGFRTQSEKIEQLEGTITTLRAELETERAKVREFEGQRSNGRAVPKLFGT